MDATMRMLERLASTGDAAARAAFARAQDRAGVQVDGIPASALAAAAASANTHSLPQTVAMRHVHGLNGGRDVWANFAAFTWDWPGMDPRRHGQLAVTVLPADYLRWMQEPAAA